MNKVAVGIKLEWVGVDFGVNLFPILKTITIGVFLVWVGTELFLLAIRKTIAVYTAYGQVKMESFSR